MTRIVARATRSCLSFCAQIALFIVACSGVCAAQTVTTFDVLVATGNLTVVGTTTVQGNALSVGGSTLAVIGGSVGVGTGTPTAQLHLVGPVVYLSTAQFKWIASKAALRAGEVTGTNWDLSNVGIHSIALGFNPLNIQPFGTISGGYSNSMNYGNGTWGVIGGGDGNGIFGINSDASAGTIGGGQSNRITNYSAGTIGGGAGNNVFSAGGTIAGGGSNSVGVDAYSNSYATVGGGAYNKAYAYASVIAGGGAIGPAQTVGGNTIDQDATGAAILGGANNNAKKSYSAIGGGAFNTAGGAYATVIGGYKNSASGDYSFAAGSAAVASARGSFVWADSQNQQLISNTTDEFKIRAGGGFVLLGSPTLATIIVSSGSLLISTSATAVNAVPNLFVSSMTGNVGVGTTLPGSKLDVQGDAQFGSGATKSTFTAAGLLKLTSSGIQWADGTISTTASSNGGGSGDAVLSATQTFSGANTFVSSITVGTTVFTQTGAIVTNMGKYLNGWQVVGSTYAVNQAAVTFTGLASSATYRVYTQGGKITGSASAGVWRVRFGSGSIDSGNNYYTMGAGFNQSGSGYSVGSGGVPTSGCFAQNTTGTMNVNDQVGIEVGPFRTVAGIANNVVTSIDSGGCYSGCQGGFKEHQFCVWGPAGSAASLDRISIAAPGTSGFTGWVFIEQLMNPNAQ